MSRRNRFCSIAPMATFDAVFVGSGINSLVGAALLAREGWNVCVLERNDVAGGCIRTSDRSDAAGVHPRGARLLASALHRLGRLRRAEGRARPARRRRTSTPTFPPAPRSRTARPRSSRARSRGTWRSSTGSRPATVPPGSGSSTRSWRTPTSRSGCSRRSSGRRPGSRSGARHSAGSGAAGCWSSPGTRSSAAATGSRRRSHRKPLAACSRRGCCTPGSARIRRPRGS